MADKNDRKKKIDQEYVYALEAMMGDAVEHEREEKAKALQEAEAQSVKKLKDKSKIIRLVSLAAVIAVALISFFTWQWYDRQSEELGLQLQKEMEERIAQETAPPKSWFDLSYQERNEYIAQGMVLFPEIFGTDRNKYDRYARWLLSEHKIFNRSPRGDLTSGGRGELVVQGQKFEDLPRIFLTLDQHSKLFIKAISEIDQNTLKRHWGSGAPENPKDRLQKWIQLYKPHAENTLDGKVFDIEGMIEEYAEKYGLN